LSSTKLQHIGHFAVLTPGPIFCKRKKLCSYTDSLI